jgi:hypothetical protein
METVKFWELIDASRKKASGDPWEQIEILVEMLAKLEPSEIVDFKRIYTELYAAAYTWSLWGAAFVIGGGCSDDGFMDFRGWLISRGEKVYREALASPESLAKSMKDQDGEGQVEGFQYAPGRAWAKKTGKDESTFPHPEVTIPHEPSGDPWEEDDVESLFPKLAKRFG